MSRTSLVKMIHMGANRMGMDDAGYREWLRIRTGKTSTKDLSDDDLAALVDAMRESGILDTPAVKRMAGANGRGRPTRKQLKAVDDYAKALGMSGIDDKAIATFCRRVTKMDSPRFLDREGIGKLLNGLSTWVKRKQRYANPDPPQPTRDDLNEI